MVAKSNGTKIQFKNRQLVVPDHPIIPFIEGDGIGIDIWAASVRVIDAAVEKAFGGRKRIIWTEILAGKKVQKETGEWLPEATITAIRDHIVAIKGPITTPVGGGIRSLNVALRQILDLFACVRPGRRDPGDLPRDPLAEAGKGERRGEGWLISCHRYIVQRNLSLCNRRF